MTNNTSSEEWRDIPGYEGLYRVSTNGRVFTYGRTWKSGRGLIRKTEDGELAYTMTIWGYPAVFLRKDGKQIQQRVHRLVAITFIPNPDEKPHVNHKSGIKTDNRIENLEWCTRSENAKHAYNAGLIKPAKGSKHYKSKLTDAQVRKIRKSGLSQRELGEKYNVRRSTIEKIVNRRTWRHL